MKNNLTKENFISFWADGYVETFDGYPSDITKYDVIKTCIEPYKNNIGTCLEIGCGGGLWTKILNNYFSKVIAIDVIPRSKHLDSDIEYYELETQDYKCTNIKNNSIDFVWSFGVFCHLSNSANKEYLKNIMRVLRPGGKAVIMFADWNTHPTLKDETDIDKYRELLHGIGWFFMDMPTIKNILNENGIIEYKDMIPKFRDRLIYFKKDEI